MECDFSSFKWEMVRTKVAQDECKFPIRWCLRQDFMILCGRVDRSRRTAVLFLHDILSKGVSGTEKYHYFNNRELFLFSFDDYLIRIYSIYYIISYNRSCILK